jgi:ribosome modulation factor
VSDRFIRENGAENERLAVVLATWRVWRTARDDKHVTAAKKKLNLEKAKLSRRKAKLRAKLIQIFKVAKLSTRAHWIATWRFVIDYYQICLSDALPMATCTGRAADGSAIVVNKSFYDKWLPVTLLTILKHVVVLHSRSS